MPPFPVPPLPHTPPVAPCPQVFELVKNSLRAVHDRFDDADKEPPPIRLVVAEGEEDVTIKVSDEGGGIPRSGLPRIWTYLYTTAKSPLDDMDKDDTDGADGPSVLAGYGYGLPISRLYARYFGGDLQILSMENCERGTGGLVPLQPGTPALLLGASCACACRRRAREWREQSQSTAPASPGHCPPAHAPCSRLPWPRAAPVPAFAHATPAPQLTPSSHGWLYRWHGRLPAPQSAGQRAGAPALTLAIVGLPVAAEQCCQHPSRSQLRA